MKTFNCWLNWVHCLHVLKQGKATLQINRAKKALSYSIKTAKELLVGNKKDDEEIILEDFISVKGLKALGNRLTTLKVKSIDPLDPIPFEPEVKEDGPVEKEEPASEPKTESKLEETPSAEKSKEEKKDPPPPPKSIDDDGQASLF